jgi:hypothetical protein
MSESSLYDRLGGAFAIAAVIEVLAAFAAHKGEVTEGHLAAVTAAG